MRIVSGALASLLLLAPAQSRAADFLVVNTNAAGIGSLSQAILNANATVEADTIEFNIPGAGPHVFAAPFPDITQPVIIDGYTETGSVRNSIAVAATNADLRIQLDGSALAMGASVLNVEADLVEIRGVSITGIPANGSGVLVTSDATGVVIDGCFVGVAPDGLTGDSDGTGISVIGSATIGGASHTTRNIVSGNNRAGILLRGADSLVDSNLIGTDRNGQPVLGNATGITVSTDVANDNRIGSLGPGNLIAGNDGDGIEFGSTAGTGNGILINRIHDNGGLGIDLGADGVTYNDDDDGDVGPNGLINFPEITFARINGSELLVEGFLRAAVGSYQLLFFRSSEADSSGFGEGELIAGSINVQVAPGQEFVRFRDTFELGSTPTDPFFVTATTRRPVLGSQDSSEFSRAIEAPVGGVELVVTNADDSGAGSLRAAIGQAKLVAESTIVFEIPGAGPHTIPLVQGFLLDEMNIVIDGFTQPGSAANTLVDGSDADIRVVLDGSGMVDADPVIHFSRGTYLLRGVAVHSGPADGILVNDGIGTRIEGCFVGTDASGGQDLGNANHGISIDGEIDGGVGGASPGRRNVISGNGLDGVRDGGFGTSIAGNFIGTDATGNVEIGNDSDGISVPGNSGSIGSDEPGRGNRIRGNGGDGIEVSDDSLLVEIRGNDVGPNDGLGIELEELGAIAGVTANDADDVDIAGANLLQNFPVLTGVKVDPESITVTGALDVGVGDFGSTYIFRVYRSETCDASGHGEGEVFLGIGSAEFGPGEEFSFELPVSVEAGGVLTATATRFSTGNTSEFSECFALPVPPPLCGDANFDDKITATDALLVLKTGVGTETCDLCVCDVNDSGATSSSDALLVLKVSVGQPLVLDCPPCP